MAVYGPRARLPGGGSLQVRVEESGKDGTFNVLLSDAAGEASVSSMVARHWVERWYSSLPSPERQRIAEAAGLANPRPEPVDPPPRFLPVGENGYAEFLPDADEEDDEELRWFALEGWVRNTSDEAEITSFRVLDERWKDVMADGRCRCQWCAPEFDQAEVTETLAQSSAA